MDNPILNVDADAIEGSVADMYKLIVRSVKIFNDIPAVQNVALEIKQRIEEFKPKISLLQGLRNPGMKQRHWDMFEEKTGKIVFCVYIIDVSVHTKVSVLSITVQITVTKDIY